MSTRSNKHIRKFNQLVDVYDPDPVEQIDIVSTRDESRLRERRTEINALQEQVRTLTADDFFSAEERTEIADNDGLPGPDSVAESHREDMLDRLESTEAALDEALESTSGLDASDDLTL